MKITSFWLSTALTTLVLVTTVVAQTLRSVNLNQQLTQAVLQCNSEHVAQLLRAGADANAITAATNHISLHNLYDALFRRLRGSVSDDPLLILALRRVPLVDYTDAHPDNTSVVESLLRAGANPNARSHDGRPPILLALSCDNGDTVPMLLISYGSDVNSADKSGTTPLMIASERNVVLLLLKHGARIDAKDVRGNTALISHANAPGDTSIMQLLLQRGASIEAKNQDGHTALWDAAHCDQPQIVRLLIHFGANVNTKDAEGRSLLRSIRDTDVSTAIVKLLKDAGASE